MKINGYEINYTEAEISRMAHDELIVVNLIDKSFPEYQSLSEGDKKALQLMADAAKIINDVSLEQDHPLNMVQKKALEEVSASGDYAKDTLTIFNSLNGVGGSNGIDKEPVQLFKGIELYPGKNFYPVDMDAQEFHYILKKMLETGKTKEVKRILNNRSMVRRDGDFLKAVDFTEYFKKEFTEIAGKLTAAADNVTNLQFKEYLKAQAEALLKYDENLDAKADTLWAGMQDTELELTISRENYDDAMTPTIFENHELLRLIESHGIEVHSKDTLGLRTGIINKKGTDTIMQFKSHMSELAKLMPYADKYEQNVTGGESLKQTMVDVDLAELKGDYAQARGGMTVAQNLPNNDKLSLKIGGGRRNVYHRQVRQTADREKIQKIIEEMLDESIQKYYNEEADHLFVVGHENGHSLGPDSTYQNSLGVYKHVIEELKADVVSLAFMPEYVKSGVIDDTMLKSIYVTQIVSRLLLKAEPQMANPHRIAELIIFNYLVKHNALIIEDSGKINIDFSKTPQIFYYLLEETIEVQLSRSPKAAKEFIEKYSHWGSTSKKASAYIRSLGVKPYKLIKSFF